MIKQKHPIPLFTSSPILLSELLRFPSIIIIFCNEISKDLLRLWQLITTKEKMSSFNFQMKYLMKFTMSTGKFIAYFWCQLPITMNKYNITTALHNIKYGSIIGRGLSAISVFPFLLLNHVLCIRKGQMFRTIFLHIDHTISMIFM